MKTRTLSLAALAWFAAAGAALAAEPVYDLNGDGRISLPEYQTVAWTQGLIADTNHDGKISKAEAKARMGARAIMLDMFWGRVDTNHDGFLTKPEMDTINRQGFEGADTNHDGALSADEIAKARARRR